MPHWYILLNTILPNFANTVMIIVKRMRYSNRICMTVINHVANIFKFPHTATSDDRNSHGIRNCFNQLNIKSLSRALFIH